MHATETKSLDERVANDSVDDVVARETRAPASYNGTIETTSRRGDHVDNGSGLRGLLSGPRAIRLSQFLGDAKRPQVGAGPDNRLGRNTLASARNDRARIVRGSFYPAGASRGAEYHRAPPLVRAGRLGGTAGVRKVGRSGAGDALTPTAWSPSFRFVLAHHINEASRALDRDRRVGDRIAGVVVGVAYAFLSFVVLVGAGCCQW